MCATKADFLRSLDASSSLGEMFDDAPDLYFFAKDRDFRFTMCNRTLLDKLGMARESEIIGLTDYEIFERTMADKYRVEDSAVFRRQQPITNRIWLVPNASGVLEWYLSSKFPLFDREGKLIGLAGLMRDCQRFGALLGPYKQMAKAIDYISGHYREPITVGELAEMTHLSVSQFERSFKKLFKITPLKYVNQVRLDAASNLLMQGSETIATIAHAVGFYDQSYFIKQFKAAKGMTPATYRRGNRE